MLPPAAGMPHSPWKIYLLLLFNTPAKQLLYRKIKSPPLPLGCGRGVGGIKFRWKRKSIILLLYRTYRRDKNKHISLILCPSWCPLNLNGIKSVGYSLMLWIFCCQIIIIKSYFLHGLWWFLEVVNGLLLWYFGKMLKRKLYLQIYKNYAVK